jgi:hypothetical protein
LYIRSNFRFKSRRTGLWVAAAILAAFSVALLVPGIALLDLSQTGTPAQASVEYCETTGAGRYERTDCSGSWIVGGSLLDGGHVIVGTVDDADQSDVGKTIDVMLHGDTAYSRSLFTPLVLIGFGAAPLLAAILIAIRLIVRPGPN